VPIQDVPAEEPDDERGADGYEGGPLEAHRIGTAKQPRCEPANSQPEQDDDDEVGQNGHVFILRGDADARLDGREGAGV
jgi:hypothetical protein